MPSRSSVVWKIDGRDELRLLAEVLEHRGLDRDVAGHALPLERLHDALGGRDLAVGAAEAGPSSPSRAATRKRQRAAGRGRPSRRRSWSCRAGPTTAGSARGSVIASNTRSRGASKIRSMRISRSDGVDTAAWRAWVCWSLVIACAPFVRSRSSPEPVEALVQHPPVARSPKLDVVQLPRPERADACASHLLGAHEPGVLRAPERASSSR